MKTTTLEILTRGWRLRRGFHDVSVAPFRNLRCPFSARNLIRFWSYGRKLAIHFNSPVSRIWEAMIHIPDTSLDVL